jgi:hypothetical protein
MSWRERNPRTAAATIAEMSPDRFRTSFGNVISARRPMATIRDQARAMAGERAASRLPRLL